MIQSEIDRKSRSNRVRHIFFAHSSHDSLAVQSLARVVEQRGYQCWYYERDAKQGENYTESVGRAIAEAACVVFFASKESVKSFEVRKELQFSHRRQKNILCVLATASTQEVVEDEMELGILLGTSTYVPFQADKPEVAATSIAAKLQAGGLAASFETPVSTEIKQRVEAPEIHWITDGREVKIQDLGEFVFVNKRIRRFLEGDQLTVLCGNKGLGKTLILRYKRSLLQTAIDNSGQASSLGVRLLPENRPYVDELGSLPSNLTGEEIKTFVEDLPNSIRLWCVSLKLSVISYDTENRKEVEHVLPTHLRNAFGKQGLAPSQIYTALLQGLTRQKLFKFLDSSQFEIDSAYRNTHSGVCLFIDRVDEATGEISRLGWINLQAGLIEAARICMNLNNHVRIYTTIREEAYANYESVTKPNLAGSVLRLSYTRDELQGMVQQLVRLYEGSDSIESFFGLKGVTNTDAGVVEDSFDYVLRHTLGRPRDLVMICSELSESGEPGNEAKFRTLVKRKGAELVSSSVFQEMSVFLDCLSDQDFRFRFYSAIPYNILTRREVIEICCKLNDLPFEAWSSVGEAAEAFRHPFCELWNCGLIGVVESASDEIGGKVQRFKQRSDRVESGCHCLPVSEFYLMHPSLQQTIHQCRDRSGYTVFESIVVGHNNIWPVQFERLLGYQRSVAQMPDGELKTKAKRIPQFLRAAMNAERSIRDYATEGIQDFAPQLLNDFLDEGFDDAALELQECLEGILDK